MLTVEVTHGSVTRIFCKETEINSLCHLVDLMADFQLSQDKDVNVDHKENSERINMLGEKSHIAISSEMECQVSQGGKMYEKIVNQTMVKVGACPHT